MGQTGSAAAQYGAHRPGGTGEQPPGAGMGTVYRPGDRTFKPAGGTHRLSALGCQRQGKREAGDQPRPPGADRRSSKPLVGFQRFFQVPAFFQDKRAAHPVRTGAHRLAHWGVRRNYL